MERYVFISHAYKDKNIAEAICKRLESAKLRCRMTSRDISAIDERPEATRKAIASSLAMVVVLTENANAAPHIEREIAHAFYTRRTIIAFRLSNTVPRRGFLFYLDNASWFDASGPDAEQRLEALTLRVTDLVLSRSVTGNHKLAQQAIKTETPIKFRGSLMGGLRTSHYRTLNILRRAAIAAFVLAVLCFLWVESREDGGLSPPENNVQSIVSRPNHSPDQSSRGTGDLVPSTAGLAFTRFGLWEPANSRPAFLPQQGSQDAPSTPPAARSGSALPWAESDAGRKGADDAPMLAARENASVSSEQEHLSQVIGLPEGTSAKRRSKGHHGSSSASDGSRFVKIKMKAQSEEGLLATRPERKGEQEFRQSRQIMDLATKENSVLKAQLRKAQEDTKQAERIADLATRQRTALEAQLTKAQEENAQLVQHDLETAALYKKSEADTHSPNDRDDVQAVQQDVNPATSEPEPGQIQPQNPGPNDIPAAPTQPLDPPG